MKDIVLKTPVGILHEFFGQSSIWADFEMIIDSWIEDIHEQLENPTGELTHRQLDRLGGNVEALKRFSGVYQYIMADIEGGDHE